MLVDQIKQLIEAGNPENGFLKYYAWDCFGRPTHERRDYQDEILKTVHNNKVSMIATARQMGKTSLIRKYIEWYSSLLANSKTLMLFPNSFSVRENMSQFNPISPCISKNTNTIELSNQSEITSYVTPTSRNQLANYHNHWDIICVDEPSNEDIFYELLYRYPLSKIIVTGGATDGFATIYNKSDNVAKLKYPWDVKPREASYISSIKSLLTETIFNEEMELGKLK